MYLNRVRFGCLVTVMVGMTIFPSRSEAWQFRDLDETPTVPIVQADSDDLIELVPTSEAFGETDDADAADSLEQPKVEAKPKTAEVDAPAPKAEVKTAQPKKLGTKQKPAASADAKPEPIPDPTLDPAPEPVPMPELGASAENKSKLLLKTSAKPMDSFGKVEDSVDAEHGIHPAQFLGVQPGVTTQSQLIAAWGEPTREIEVDKKSSIFLYTTDSFKQVEATVKDKSVVSVLVHLKDPVLTTRAAKQLGLEDNQSVPIPDEFGEILGHAYPERGMLFSYPEGDDASKVAAILLEPVSGEMFRLRAQFDFTHNYETSLADLDQAIRLDPVDADAHWFRAELLDTAGRTRDGLKSVQKAIRLKPTHPGYRISRSRLYAKTNRLETAIQELHSLIKELDLSNSAAARAHNVLGDLLAMGPGADHQLALKHHLKAIDYGSKCVTDRRFGVRRMAKHDLVTAHMSVARDIAVGNFQRQSEVVPKWLLRATELADEFISDDKGDELLEMHIFRDTLASYSELQQGTFESAIAVEEALRKGRDLIAKADSEIYKTQVERLLGEILLHAAKIHRARGKHDSALQFANNAVGLLNNTNDDWEKTSHDKYLQAQLNFVIGSIYAIRDDNHYEATDWYAKARKMFVGSSFTTPLYSKRGHGEMYVSMGLSFWEIGAHDKGVRITQTGADLMKQAVESGSLQLQAMAVPYGNLATMHAKLGRSEKSQEYAKLVAKLETVKANTTR